VGLSSFGAQIFASVLTSAITNLPSGSENCLRIWNSKLLLERMHVPALALEKLLKMAEKPHSEVHQFSFSFEQWTS